MQRVHNRTHRLAARTLLVAFSALLVVTWAKPAEAAKPDHGDWPCIQRKVPTISAGVIWAGPPIEDLKTDWRGDADISRLAGTIARRAISLEKAKSAITQLVEGLGSDKNEKLTMLFAGALTIINNERSSIMNGIARYSRRQGALAEKIERVTAELGGLDSATEGEDLETKREELRAEILWDTRIFVEREKSLVYICEQPVLLEQRIFTLGREIMNQLD